MTHREGSLRSPSMRSSKAGILSASAGSWMPSPACRAAAASARVRPRLPPAADLRNWRGGKAASVTSGRPRNGSTFGQMKNGVAMPLAIWRSL
ncbi:hypothetical protein D3C87_1827290 [compost metagenome]